MPESRQAASTGNLCRMLEVGDDAPDFELPATGGSPIRLSEAVKRNRATVIAFYVLDFTPG